MNNPFSVPIEVTATGGTAPITWGRGKGHFAAQGTFGGTAVNLQYSLDGGVTWLDASDESLVTKVLEAAGGFNFELPDCLVRPFLVGGTDIELEIFILSVN